MRTLEDLAFEIKIGWKKKRKLQHKQIQNIGNKHKKQDTNLAILCQFDFRTII